MIRFHFSAEWGLDQPAIDWLTNAYFPSKWTEAVRQIQEVRAIDGRPFDPNRTSRFWNNQPEVNVLLKLDNWVTAEGSGAAGQFFPMGANGGSTIPDLWVNWTRETHPEVPVNGNLFGRIVRHELIHLLLWMQYPTADGDEVRYNDEYLNSQHGRTAPDKDIFLLALNRRIDDYYPLNHSSSPGHLPV